MYNFFSFVQAILKKISVLVNQLERFGHPSRLFLIQEQKEN